ncbi:hypothetical protein JZ751_010114 [Albula glossodonta]|uniref:Sushi domain-containing protein n=1 Tax=Albula glossodonta TaxID=121402 RepID=A0A8T2MT56_9TELE|nr:hypothetical protein JZ751_010114 [Albula glossodonta]
MNERLSMTSRCSRLLVLLVSLSLSLNQDIVSANEECPPPPQREKTKPFNRTLSYPEGHMFVYACIDGYVRKVGTSAYTWCMKEKERTPQWDNIDGPLALVCIPDPKIKKTTKAPVAIQTTPSWRKALPTRLVKPRPTVPATTKADSRTTKITKIRLITTRTTEMESRRVTPPVTTSNTFRSHTTTKTSTSTSSGVVSGIMVIFLIAVGVGASGNKDPNICHQQWSLLLCIPYKHTSHKTKSNMSIVHYMTNILKQKDLKPAAVFILSCLSYHL